MIATYSRTGSEEGNRVLVVIMIVACLVITVPVIEQVREIV
jgi:hypothetical protein